jgi:hypothetical protein
VSEDEFFRFALTFIDGGRDTGWTTHYAPKHPPLSSEMLAALEFLGGFHTIEECPEFDFDVCQWRFLPDDGGRDRWGESDNTAYAHRWFDAHAEHFSTGIEKLLQAHEVMGSVGMSFLDAHIPAAVAPSILDPAPSAAGQRTPPGDGSEFEFDVAVSFAGPQRELALKLADAVSSDIRVFYDEYAPEKPWGKDLPTYFDYVYRKASRFCVVFVSAAYGERAWTDMERRSALARSVEEKGGEYILPIQVDDSELEGVPPTVGYLSLSDHTIEGIAELLLKKLGDA